MAAGARHTPLPAGSACTSVYRWLRSRLVADASGAPVLRDRDRSAGRARQGRCKPRDLCSTTGTGWPLPCEETTGLSRQPRTGADQHRCIRDPAERSALRLRRRNRSGTANRANFQLSGYSLSRPNKRKRNERVRLRSRLAGRPAPRVHPTPPSRMHHQRDPGMPRASWVLGAWSVALMSAPLVGCWSSPNWGEHGFRSTRNGRGRGEGRKKFTELVTASKGAERTFFGPSTPDGPRASRNPPAESAGPRLGAGSQARRAKREADPRPTQHQVPAWPSPSRTGAFLEWSPHRPPRQGPTGAGASRALDR